MSPLDTGIHQIEAATYHDDPCPEPSLSSTIAKEMIARTPLHAWTISPNLNPDHEPLVKKEFDVGRAAHRATLGAGENYIAIPDGLLASNGAASTKAAKEFIEQARESGLTPLKSVEVAQIEAMAAKIREKLVENQIVLDPARSEMAAIGQIEGVWCRAMIDNAPADPQQPLYDFKTTTDASPDAVVRAVMNYGYDVQAAHYIETWKAATGEDRLFRFIFQEKKAPYEACVLQLGSDSLAIGHKKIAFAREQWRNCMSSGHWPGYPAGVLTAILPPWFTERWLEREILEAERRRSSRPSQAALDASRRNQAPFGYDHEGDE